MIRPLGVTLSKWSGNVDFGRMVRAGVSFVSIRTTIGSAGEDERWREYWEGAHKAGLLRRAFHYLKHDSSAFDQAAHFHAVSPIGELPPVVDVEDGQLTWDQVHKFAQRTWLLTMYPPTIYSRKNLVDLIFEGHESWLPSHHLWVAEYSDVVEPTPVEPWGTWHFWQYTDQAPGEDYGVLGNTAVLDVYNGNLGGLLDLANGYRISRWMGKKYFDEWEIILKSLP